MVGEAVRSWIARLWPDDQLRLARSSAAVCANSDLRCGAGFFLVTEPALGCTCPACMHTSWNSWRQAGITAVLVRKHRPHFSLPQRSVAFAALSPCRQRPDIYWRRAAYRGACIRPWTFGRHTVGLPMLLTCKDLSLSPFLPF